MYVCMYVVFYLYICAFIVRLFVAFLCQSPSETLRHPEPLCDGISDICYAILMLGHSDGDNGSGQTQTFAMEPCAVYCFCLCNNSYNNNGEPIE